MPNSSLIGALGLTLAVCVVNLPGCGPSTATPSAAAGNGVNDVKAACDLRAAWSQASARNCTNCVFVAPLQACDCDPTPERGRCVTQQSVSTKEPDCTIAIASCLNACKTSDCACIDGCYAGHAACRAAASAIDGCVAEVCGPLCR